MDLDEKMYSFSRSSTDTFDGKNMDVSISVYNY